MNKALSRMATLATVVAIGASVFLYSEKAEAQLFGYNHARTQLDLQVGVHWWGLGLATGARLNVPLIASVGGGSFQHALYFTFGADFYWSDVDDRGYGAGVGIPLTVKWEAFWRVISLFVEAGVNVFLSPDFLRDTDDWNTDVGSWFIFAGGLRIHFNDAAALLVRIGSPYSSLGFTFTF